jgi:hypothetical protein
VGHTPPGLDGDCPSPYARRETAVNLPSAEDLLEELGDAGGGIAPDPALLVADDQEEPVERLADDVAV